jgi:hypothetical protein
MYLSQRIMMELIFGAGWERMVLQILFLGPSNLLEPKASFAQMSQKLIVSPIVKTLVFSKVPEKVDKLVKFFGPQAPSAWVLFHIGLVPLLDKEWLVWSPVIDTKYKQRTVV